MTPVILKLDFSEPLIEFDNDHVEWEAESILYEKRINNNRYYLANWKIYPANEKSGRVMRIFKTLKTLFMFTTRRFTLFKGKVVVTLIPYFT